MFYAKELSARGHEITLLMPDTYADQKESHDIVTNSSYYTTYVYYGADPIDGKDDNFKDQVLASQLFGKRQKNYENLKFL